MFQNQLIALVLCFSPMLIYLEAHQLNGEKFTIVKNGYAGRGHKLSIQTVRSRLECNKRCTNTEFCNAVNFGNQTCELLTLSDDYEDHLQSRPGWTLSYKKNTCLSKPCENGGRCNEEIGGYTCTCATGYEGVHCQDETNECLSNPCEHGGTCEDILAGYNCTCAGGYGGVNCQNSLTEVMCRGGVTPVANVTVSSFYSETYDESKVCLETEAWWYAAQSDTTPWVNIVLPSTVTIIQVQVNSYFLSCKFLAEQNGSLAHIDTFNRTADTSESMVFTLSSPVTTQHVRFEILSFQIWTLVMEVGLME